MPVSASTARTTVLPLEFLHPSALYKAFLAHEPAVRRWYPHDPRSRRFPDPTPHYPAERRAQVADILADQNRAFGSGDATVKNLERFKRGAGAIVTGQQVGLFGGPLYSILKAITSIKLAEEQTKSGVDTVPIFWLATEDHDLDEVSYAQVLTPDHQLRKLALEDARGEEHRVGDVEFPKSIEALTEKLRDLCGSNEVTDFVARCYAPGETFGDSFARLFAWLFREYGLILVDNRDPRLHRIAAPAFSKAAAQAIPFNTTLRQRTQELESSGYHAQVHVDASSTLLFHHQSGRRIAIKIDNGKLTAGKKTWTADELAGEVERAPQDFSANALLRPIVQDFLLPTSAYIGGAAEIAYFAQSVVVYTELLGRVTPIVPRGSATLIEPGVARMLEKYDLQPQDAFVTAEELRLEVAKRALPPDTQRAFESASKLLEQELVGLERHVEAVDPTLRGAAETATRKIRYQMRRLRERAARAQLRKQVEMDRQLRRISNSLYPNKNLQERELSGIYFLAKFGVPLLRTLSEQLRTDTSDHQFIWL